MNEDLQKNLNEIKKLPHITKLVSPSRAARVPKGEKKELFIFNNCVVCGFVWGNVLTFHRTAIQCL